MSETKYLEMYGAVYSRKWLVTLLNVIRWVITALTIVTYGWFIGYSFVKDLKLSIFLLVVTAVPFIAISVMRRIINAPRPYEVFDCEALLPVKVSGGSGRSFPSRHVASVFIIGSAFTFVVPYVGIILLCLGVVLAACRVLLGIHFLRDAIVGAVIGGAAGVIGMLIANIFLH